MVMIQVRLVLIFLSSFFKTLVTNKFSVPIRVERGTRYIYVCPLIKKKGLKSQGGEILI